MHIILVVKSVKFLILLLCFKSIVLLLFSVMHSTLQPRRDLKVHFNIPLKMTLRFNHVHFSFL